MFESLSQRLTGVLGKLRGKGRLSEEDVELALREVRVALLEADVALPVVKQFVKEIREKAVGEEVVQSVSPAQQVVKIVHDHLVQLLGEEQAELQMAGIPTVILMVGLQGSGKTTTTGKLGLRLRTKQGKKVLVASLDVQRPAAQEQLETIAGQAEIASLPIIKGQSPLEITTRALDTAKKEGYDILLLDTAGRLHIDSELMEELKSVKAKANPSETLLVADSLTGQDAVNVAKAFNEEIGVTGIVLTRMDGDGRGGAALSMRSVTGCPIKFAGMGEKLSELEPFYPDRVASRILDMGDVVSLVEQAMEHVDQEEAEKVAKKAMSGKFDLEDLAAQMRQMRKMGGMGKLMGMLPGIGQMKAKLEEANIDERMILRQESIIYSMTPDERRFPDKLNASRKRRIAAGAGVEVQDVNKLLKQYKQMSGMMKKLKKMGKKGLMRGGMQQLFR